MNRKEKILRIISAVIQVLFFGGLGFGMLYMLWCMAHSDH